MHACDDVCRPLVVHHCCRSTLTTSSARRAVQPSSSVVSVCCRGPKLCTRPFTTGSSTLCVIAPMLAPARCAVSLLLYTGVCFPLLCGRVAHTCCHLCFPSLSHNALLPLGFVRFTHTCVVTMTLHRWIHCSWLCCWQHVACSPHECDVRAADVQQLLHGPCAGVDVGLHFHRPVAHLPRRPHAAVSTEPRHVRRARHQRGVPLIKCPAVCRDTCVCAWGNE